MCAALLAVPVQADGSGGHYGSDSGTWVRPGPSAFTDSFCGHDVTGAVDRQPATGVAGAVGRDTGLGIRFEGEIA